MQKVVKMSWKGITSGNGQMGRIFMVLKYSYIYIYIYIYIYLMILKKNLTKELFWPYPGIIYLYIR